MPESYLGEIQMFAFGYAPRDWMVCDGKVLRISDNESLFAILGNTYGGDGKSTFALPDLRGRSPVHVGSGVSQGEQGGEATHMLTLPEMPIHAHPVWGSSRIVSVPGPAGNTWGTQQSMNEYARTGSNPMAANAVAASGKNAPHVNLQPYLVATFCICVRGIVPAAK
jgi:microcystin-dependent protein